MRRTQAADGAWYGRWGVELHLRHMVGAARRSGRSARIRARTYRPAGGALARGPPESDGGWGETLRARTTTRAEPGAASRCPSQTAWALLGLFAGGTRRAAPAVERGHRVPAPNQQPGRRLGGPALERHGIPPRLLSQVPPLRPLLPALGARDLVPGHAVESGGSPQSRPPPNVRLARPDSLQGLGRFGLGTLAALGRFGVFLGRGRSGGPRFPRSRSVRRSSASGSSGFRSLSSSS